MASAFVQSHLSREHQTQTTAVGVARTTPNTLDAETTGPYPWSTVVFRLATRSLCLSTFDTWFCPTPTKAFPSLKADKKVLTV